MGRTSAAISASGRAGGVSLLSPAGSVTGELSSKVPSVYSSPLKGGESPEARHGAFQLPERS